MTNGEKDNLRKEVIKLLDDFVAIALKYPKLKHPFRYALGAIYALNRSIKLGHKDRKSYDDTDESKLLEEIKTISEAVKNNNEPPKTWEAGFFCNASFARIDAINERFLKAIEEAIKGPNPAVSRQGTKLDRIARKIRAKGLNNGIDIEIPTDLFSQFRRVVANKLKHEIDSQAIEDAIGLQENDHVIIINSLKDLVKLFKQEKIQQLLAEKYGEN